MIESFRSGALKRLWKGRGAKGIDPRSLPRVRRILSALDAASAPHDMDLPGFHFHELKGDRKGQFAVTIRANWRIVFEWENDRAVRIDMEDYHG